MAPMVRRRGILGGIALVGAGVAVAIIVSRAERGRVELAATPAGVNTDRTQDSAPARDTSEVAAVSAAVGSPKSEQGWSLRGRLLRYPDPEALEPTQPAAGALLRLSFDEDTAVPRSDFAPREVRSGSEGRFEFTGVPGKAWYRLLVDAEGCALRAVGFELPELEDPGTKEIPDIVLDEPQRLEVVVKAPNGHPVECETATARFDTAHEEGSHAQLPLEQEPIEAERRGGGEYVFERLARGTHLVLAEAKGRGEAIESVRVPHPGVLELQLEPEISRVISGTIRSANGEPIPGAIVENAEGKKVRADDQGH